MEQELALADIRVQNEQQVACAQTNMQVRIDELNTRVTGLTAANEQMLNDLVSIVN